MPTSAWDRNAAGQPALRKYETFPATAGGDGPYSANMLFQYIPSGARHAMTARTVQALRADEQELCFALSWSGEAQNLTVDDGVHVAAWDLRALDDIHASTVPGTLAAFIARLVRDHPVPPAGVELICLDEQARQGCESAAVEIRRSVGAATAGRLQSMTISRAGASMAPEGEPRVQPPR